MHDAKENREKTWPREILRASGRPPGFHAAIFFSVVSLRVTHDGLSEREVTRSLEGFLFRSEAAIEILARISIAASASPLTISASLGKKNNTPGKSW